MTPHASRDPDTPAGGCPGRSFGIYVHFPFCRSRCGYCDFPSVAALRIPVKRYTRAVLAELEARAAEFSGMVPRTVYFGGGTPSLWAGEGVPGVLDAVRRLFGPQDDLEVTLEANPGDVTAASLVRLRAAGVNRLSLGVQHLDDRRLRELGRRHDAEGARRAVGLARLAGFSNVGCDLIFGLPGQRVAEHLAQIELLAQLSPDHVSAYSLSLAPASPLFRGGWRPADPDRVAAMMEAGRALLERRGYLQYEVSNFAPPRLRSRHNLLVWQGRPYLGLGAHAHSMRLDGRRSLRRENPSTRLYSRAWHDRRHGGGWTGEYETISEGSSRFEVMFLGLRTVDGVHRTAYEARFGEDPMAHFGPELLALQDQGLVQLDRHAVRPTRRGIWFADEIALRLCPAGGGAAEPAPSPQ